MAECPLDRLLCGTTDSTCRPQLSCSARQSDFNAIKTHCAVTAHRSRIDRSWSKRIRGDQIPATLLWHADETFLSRLVDEIAERRLVVLKRSHLLELFFDAAAPLQRELDNFAELLL